MPTHNTSNPTLDAFLDNNPNVNFSTANLFERIRIDSLHWEGENKTEIVEALLAYQRLLRVTNNNTAYSDTLYRLNIHSAQHIAAMSLASFQALVGNTITDATVVYNSAKIIAENAAHLAATAYNTVTPYSRSLRVNNISPKMIQEFESLNGYDEIFGTLRTCNCDECKSIFGPSAYFVDLMRMIDKHITHENTIADGYKLLDRRPDLLNISLTCENTTTEIPYLQLVNEILERNIKNHVTITNTYQELARKTYPFNLPYHLPLDFARNTINQAGTSLAKVIRTFNPTTPFSKEEVIETLNLSFELYELIRTPAKDNVSLAKAYGVSDLAASIQELRKPGVFMAQTGLTAEQLKQLFRQNLNDEDRTNGGFIPYDTFINLGSPNFDQLAIVEYASTPEIIDAFIDNLNNDTLDRIHRFVRLAQSMGWTYEELGSAFIAIEALELDEAALANIAKVKYLVDRFNTSVFNIISLIFDMNILTNDNNAQTPNNQSTPSFSPQYWHATLAKLVGLTMNDYFVLLNILEKQEQEILTLDTVIQIQDVVAWLNAWDMNVYELDYLMSGFVNTYVNPGFATDKITDILQSFAVLIKPLYVLPTDFNNNNLSEVQVPNLFTQLLDNNYEDAIDTILPQNKVNESDIAGMTLPNIAALLKTKGYAFKSELISSWLDKSGNDAFAQGILDHLISLEILRGDGIVNKPIADSDVTWKTIPTTFQTVLDNKRFTPTINIPLTNDQATRIKERVNSAYADQQNKLQEFMASSLAIDVPLFIEIENITYKLLDFQNAISFLASKQFSSNVETQLYLSELSRWTYIAQKFQLSADEMQYLFDSRNQLGLQAVSLDLETIQHISQLKSLLLQLSSTTTNPVALLSNCLNEQNLSSDFLSLVNWNADEFETLKTQLFPSNTFHATGKQIYVLNTCFNLRAKTYLSIDTLNAIRKFPTMPANDTNWSVFTSTMDTILDEIKQRASGDQFTALYKKISDPILEHQRTAMVGYLLYLLGGEYNDERKLSEFLLIDVSMNSATNISLVKQALNSVQLYLQRCRLHLEKGVVIHPDSFHESWWEWIMDYRVWEANRKVFMYPENYLDPSLRKTKTSLFKNLENELSQGNVDQVLVESAFTNYMNDLETLAQLQYVDAYNCIVHEDGIEYDTLYFFGRTQTSPYEFYQITRKKQVDLADAAEVWSEWEKINVPINADFITPVYAFNRLFIFWIEIRKKDVRDHTTSDANKKATVWKADIKFTYHNFSGDWMPAQTIVADKVINIESELPMYAPHADLFAPSKNSWYKVCANVFSPDTGDNTEEKIIIHYGPVVSSFDQSFQFPQVASPDDDFYDFKQTMVAANAYFPPVPVSPQVSLLSNNPLFPAEGSNQQPYYFPVHPMIVMDSEFRSSSVLVNGELLVYGTDQYTLASNLPEGELAPFLSFEPELTTSTLNVRSTLNAIFSNYAAGLSIPEQLEFYTASKTILGATQANNIGKYDLFAVKNNIGKFVITVQQEAFLIESQYNQKIGNALKYNDYSFANNLSVGYIAYSSDQEINTDTLTFTAQRISTNALGSLGAKLFVGGIDELLAFASQQQPLTATRDFSRFQPQNIVAPSLSNGDQVSFSGPYGNYYWELFFHAPLLISKVLNNNQQFLDAEKWLQYIFNPTVAPGDNHKNFWQYLPFRNRTQETLADQLQNQNEIEVYNDDPFDPHAIAQLRPGAYEKNVVMQYIDNLLDWGDFMFSKYTWESITTASMLYMYAYDLLGPRPTREVDFTKTDAITYGDIVEQNSATGSPIPQFFTQLENAIAARVENLLSVPTTPATTKAMPFSNLEAYFQVPENSLFVAYWDRVEDRLYKIRNGLNIKGIRQSIALFEPPIDPLQLIQAAANGGNFFDIATQTQGNISTYRFFVVLEKAKSFTQMVMSLGSNLLAALEKRDFEKISQLRSTQEVTIQNMILQIKQQQIAEQESQLNGLMSSLDSAQNRFNHYDQLSYMNDFEVASMALSISATALQQAATNVRGLSVVPYMLPNIFGLADGGQNYGAAVQTGAQVLSDEGMAINQAASILSTKAQYERRKEEWSLQKEIAQFEIEQINTQIDAAKTRISISKQELNIQNKTIQNSTEVDNFLKSKYTNAELYQWMLGRLSTLYFEAYKLASNTAVIAQQAYNFELDTNEQFIAFDSWDSLHKGLLAGESLMFSLQQMEKSYLINNTRRFEIEKTISLRQHFPDAFLKFKYGAGDNEKGVFNFQLKQSLFDFDFPSHYARKIKAISISIPAVVGPYQNINATLTQNSSSILMQPLKSAVEYLLDPTVTPPDSSVLRENWIPSQQIALSKGIEDSGMFVLNFNDERYLPFEGTGAVSNWTLKMPQVTNRFNFASISDVIVKVYYTALDGGEKFGADVMKLHINQNAPLVNAKIINLKQAFPSAWSQFIAAGVNRPSLAFKITDDVYLPNLDVDAKALFIQFKLADSLGSYTITSSQLITLQMGDATNPNLANWKVNINKNYGALPDQSIPNNSAIPSQLSTAWSLIMESVPPQLITDGKIDETKLLDIVVAVVYDTNFLQTNNLNLQSSDPVSPTN